jgi:chromosome segregation ATPase
MTNDEMFQLLFGYIDSLEAELKDANPERFLQLIQQRERFWPLLQKQREVIGILQNAHQDYQARITELEAEIASLKSQQKDAQAEHQDRPNTDRKF